MNYNRMTWKLWKYMAYKSFLVKKKIITNIIVQPVNTVKKKELTDNNKNVDIKFSAHNAFLE